MANDSVAAIDCTITVSGEIRMKKKGRYKYYLWTEDFGPQFFNTGKGQQFLIGHMRELGCPVTVAPEKPQAAANDPIHEAANDPVNEEENEKGFLGW